VTRRAFVALLFVVVAGRAFMFLVAPLAASALIAGLWDVPDTWPVALVVGGVALWWDALGKGGNALNRIRERHGSSPSLAEFVEEPWAPGVVVFAPAGALLAGIGLVWLVVALAT
jgi:hypothetical protein